MEALIVMELMKRLDTETLENMSTKELSWYADHTDDIFDDEAAINNFFRQADQENGMTPLCKANSPYCNPEFAAILMVENIRMAEKGKTSIQDVKACYKQLEGIMKDLFEGKHKNFRSIDIQENKMADKMKMEILDDGTITVETDGVSGKNHKSADEFLKMLEDMTGGGRETKKRKKNHKHNLRS